MILYSTNIVISTAMMSYVTVINRRRYEYKNKNDKNYLFGI